MKRAMVGLLLMLLVSCAVSFGQDPRSAPKNLPQIVGRFKQIHQTDPKRDIVVFTPRSSGLFRISGAFLIRNPAGDGEWRVFLNWKDNRDRAAVIAEVESNGEQPTISNPWVFAARAGVPVQISFVAFGYYGGSVYDAFYVIERLSKIPSF
jgi:hypothetical protein